MNDTHNRPYDKLANQRAIRCLNCKLALRRAKSGTLVHVVNGSADCPHGGGTAEVDDLW
jgi:hypothetical protein